MQKKQHIVVLSGAGISEESNLKTFRDADGLWEGHNIMEVASPVGWRNNPNLVLHFYNQRRKQLKQVQPNKAHLLLKKLEDTFRVSILTQNVDDLHERAGNKNIIHLHGELKKVRSVKNDTLVYPWEDDLHWGDTAEDKEQLRPHIVWFGEAVPMMKKATEIARTADIFLIIGTSMQVYPAAGLIDEITTGIPIYFIDPKPQIPKNAFKNLTIIEEKAVKGMKILCELLYRKS